MLQGDNGTQARLMGPTPILFVSVGSCADRALQALSAMGKRLKTPVQGPFGLLSLDPLGGEILASHCTWLSDFELPASPEACGLVPDVGDSEEQLVTIVSSLSRHLRAAEPVADPASPGRLRLTSYVVVDLSVEEATAGALRLMRVLRRADQGHDMVLLGLTARTATSDAELEEAWFGRWTQLLASLQDEPLAQKIYLLDGRNTAGTWLDRPDQLDQLAAEFLYHHGITCRGALRQVERRRVGPKENILNICGSFGVRRITTDLSEVAARVAQRLAYDDLADLYQRRPSPETSRQIEDASQTLVKEIQRIYDRPYWSEPAAARETSERSGDFALRDEEVTEALGRTVSRVCAHNPIGNMCHFLKCLQPRLRRLATRYRLVERERTRAYVAETLRKQEEQTYAPMRVWLGKADAKWTDRFTPTKSGPARVTVSRPAGKISFRVGLFFFILGLGCIAGGLYFQERFFVFGGGLLALVATVLMMLPTGWTDLTRTRVPEGRDEQIDVPSIPYRRRASLAARGASLLLAIVGVGAVAWSLWPVVWSSAMMLSAGAAALAALIGLGILLSGPVQVRPDQAWKREAPGHLGPPAWGWRVVGLLGLASGWGILSLAQVAPVRVDTSIQWGVHIGGLLCLLAAAVLALRPRVGLARPVDPIPKVPEPLNGGISRPESESGLIRELGAMTQWIGQMTLDPEQCLRRGGMAQTPRMREVLFDLMAPDWDRQLAEAFRRALKVRSDQSLRDLVFEPRAWASCMVNQLRYAGTPVSSDLTVVFISQVVRAWLDSLTLKQLVSYLELDLNRFGSLVGRLASANWPAPRVEPDMSIGVVAMDSALWEALAPAIKVHGFSAAVHCDGNGPGDGITVLHFAQGLTQGWRGYPALPGQQNELCLPERTDVRELEGHQGAAQLPGDR